MSEGVGLCYHLKQLVALTIRFHELVNNLIDCRSIIEFKFSAERISKHSLCHIAIEVCLVFDQFLLQVAWPVKGLTIRQHPCCIDQFSAIEFSPAANRIKVL